MKAKRFLILLVLGLTLFGIAAAARPAAAAGKVFQSRYAGKGADGTWVSCVGDNCSYTSIYVADTVYRYDGTKFNSRTLSYSTSFYDVTTGIYTYSYGYAENPTFSIDKKLTRATANAAVPVTVCTYDPLTGNETCVDGGTVHISATWNGDGDLIRGSYKGRWVSKNFTQVFQFRGQWRGATATALVNGASPGEFGWGQIFDMKEANMYSCHGQC